MKTLFSVLVAISSSFSYADSWPGADEIVDISSNGQYLVRTAPGDGHRNTKISIFSRQGSSNYVLHSAFFSENPISPVYVAVTEKGTVFTVDNWGELGHGALISIFTVEGELLRSYRLKEIYSDEQLKLLKNRTSISSIHWMCRWCVPVVRHGVLFVQDALGGNLQFYEKDGTYERLVNNVCAESSFMETAIKK